MGRKMLHVVSGVVVGGVVIGLGEALGHAVFPAPPGIDPQHIKPGDIPASSMAMVLMSWALGAFAGGWVAGRLSGRSSAVRVGLVLMALGVANMVMIPSPLWFWAGGLIAFLPSALLGAKLSQPRSIGS